MKSVKSKCFGLVFLQTSVLTRMKFDVVLKQFKQNILKLLQSEICVVEGTNCCFTDCAGKLKC